MAPRKKRSARSCNRCGGGGCAHCGFSGLESRRLAMAKTEHPVVTHLDVAATAWAESAGSLEAKHFVEALLAFARTVNEALAAPDVEGSN